MLDDLQKIAKLDPGNILGSIERLPEQIGDAWRAIHELNLPETYKEVNNIVISGMGGSALGGRIAHYLESKNIQLPIEVATNYHLPNYVNKKSLVVLSSYSGNTEETIASAMDAIKREAKIIGITTGGKLFDILAGQKSAIYIIDPKNNPSGQPRMGLGYSIASILGILARLNFTTTDEAEITGVIEITNKYIKEFGVRTHTKNNIAKIFAEKLARKLPVLISSEHLIGSAHAFKNQLNENAKTFSMNFEISELNHHLMEGLKYPVKIREVLHFVFIESGNYYERILKRYPITQDVISQNGFPYEIYKTQSVKRLEEVFEILVLGSYVSFYLAILHGINPTPIPWVDYFKEKME